jgi:hypothetical protein
MVHKDRRWWLNIKVKERPFAEGSSAYKFYNLQKLCYLPALSSHCLYHKHLEWLKLMQEQLWCICLTNHKLKTSCPANISTKPHATLLRVPSKALIIVSIYVSSRTVNGVPLCPMTWNKLTSKWQDKQTMNTSTSLLFTIYLAFYFEMRRRMSTMGVLQIFTMNYAWLRLVSQAFP